MRHVARIACEPRVTAPTHHCICEEFLNHVKPTVRAFVGLVSSKPPALLRYLRVCVAFNTNISRVAALAHQRVREKPRQRFPTTCYTYGRGHTRIGRNRSTAMLTALWSLAGSDCLFQNDISRSSMYTRCAFGTNIKLTVRGVQHRAGKKTSFFQREKPAHAAVTHRSNITSGSVS
jgi:hypothetical protein